MGTVPVGGTTGPVRGMTTTPGLECTIAAPAAWPPVPVETEDAEDDELCVICACAREANRPGMAITANSATEAGIERRTEI